MNAPALDRRRFVGTSLAALAGTLSLRDLVRAAAVPPEGAKRGRSCILLWMAGGPSQIDTFDPKTGPTGGPLKAIDTAAPGVRVTELLPNVAKHMKRLAVLRGMSTKEGDHARATYQLRTGYAQQEPLQYPTLGAWVSKELAKPSSLPGFVSIATQRGLNDGGYSSGYLGPDHAPLLVGNSDTDPYAAVLTEKALGVPNLAAPKGVGESRGADRMAILRSMNADFVATRDALTARSLGSAYERALALMGEEARSAFDLDREKKATRDAYGRNLFGQGCLLARRLVERGVPFVEVSLGRVGGASAGWDTHQRNFDSLKSLCGVLDPAWAALMADLADRGLLDTTTVLWMGEFGRTPRINPGAGRDHYPNAWTTVIGGGGIKGGQAVGKTSPNGAEVTERPVAVADLLATLCGALKIDRKRANMSNIGRPIPLTERDAKPVAEVIA